MRLLLNLFILVAAALSASAQAPAGVDPLEPARRDYFDGKFDTALAALDKVADDPTIKSKLLDLRGAILLEQKKYDEALAAFTAAHEADPNVFPPHIHMGDTYLRQGKWAQARELYQEVMSRSNVLMVHELLRYGVLLTYLGEKDDVGAKEALSSITFPSESPSYYYSQAAWAFAHGDKRSAEKWLRTAGEMYQDPKKTSWFARPLHDLGWIKNKPQPVIEPLTGP
jgi:tetratricopeptide (TPR) repeat protein